MGDPYSPAIQALNAGLTWIRDEVTLPWAHARIAALGQKLATGLAGIEGVTVNTPGDRMAGLVCFNITGVTPKAVSDAAFARGFTIRPVDQRPCPSVVRASTGWWCAPTTKSTASSKPSAPSPGNIRRKTVNNCFLHV